MPPDVTASVVRLRPRLPARRDRDELAFLPAALEIIETPASPTARLTAMTIVALLAVAIVWACVGRVDIIATAKGRIVPEGRSKTIQPFETGVIKTIHVIDGQHVTAGQTLLELDPTENQAERDKAMQELTQARLDVARLRALLAETGDGFQPPPEAAAARVETARRQLQAQAGEQAAKLADLDHQIAAKVDERQEDEADIARLDATLPMLEGHAHIRAEGVRTGYGNQIDLLDARRQVMDQQHQRLEEQQKVGQAEQETVALRQQRTRTEAEFRRGLLDDLAKAESEAADHAQEVVRAAQRTALQTLSAPVAGTVQELAVHTVGGVVTPAQKLLVIVPDDARLEVEVNLANRDVGFVHAGQEVEVKVEAFDFTRYGFLHGQVSEVSKDAVSDENRDATSQAKSDPDKEHPREAAYVARIAVREDRVQTEQGDALLTPGMTVTAEIRTGRRRVISYLLSPLARYAHESVRER